MAPSERVLVDFNNQPVCNVSTAGMRSHVYGLFEGLPLFLVLDAVLLRIERRS